MATSRAKAKSKHPTIFHPDHRPDWGMLVPVRYLGKRYYQEWINCKPRRPIKNWLAAEIESRGNPVLPDRSLIVCLHEWSVMLVNDTNESWEPVRMELLNEENSHLWELSRIIVKGKTPFAPLYYRSYYFRQARSSGAYHFTAGPALLERGKVDFPGMNVLAFGERLYSAAVELDKSSGAKNRAEN